ncbi:hypothetical protein, partial [Shigella sonnei]
SGKNIIRWLLKKRTNGSVRYCQYTSLKVSTEAGAAPGIYTISVTQLAQAQSLRTDSPTIIASTK